MHVKKLLMTVGASAMMAVSLPLSSLAASTVLVTPTNTQGWSTADTRPGGAVTFVADATAPAGSGALRLTTDASNDAKAQYLHAANTPLADVTELSYYTKQNSASFPNAAASYQLPVNLTGTGGFTTLVYEPYQNPTQGTVTADTWQQWDVANGLFWSSKTVTCQNGVVTGAAGGPATYTLADIKALCPNANVIGFGVNVGTYNPLYDVETDLVSFNGTAYNFEPTLKPTTKDSCKNGGWTKFNSPMFFNQGDCVSYVNNGK